MKSLQRFHVTTYGVSPDLKRIDPLFGNINRGDVVAQTLRLALEAFRQIETHWSPSASRFVIKADHGIFIVRAGDKQLTFATEDQTVDQAVPLTSAEIIARLAQGPSPVSVVEPRPPPEAPWRSVATVLLVCAGVVLTVFALKPWFAPAKTGLPDDITFITVAADLAKRRTSVVGIYATGEKLGDRHLMVSPDGHVVFSELGPRQSIAAGADSYRIGERNQRTCLVTPRSGVIEALDADTLLYYGDTYRRIKSAP